MPQGQYRIRRRSDRAAYERDSRYEHDYAESPATLFQTYEEGLERTRQRLEQQREVLRRLARIRFKAF